MREQGEAAIRGTLCAEMPCKKLFFTGMYFTSEGFRLPQFPWLRKLEYQWQTCEKREVLLAR